MKLFLISLLFTFSLFANNNFTTLDYWKQKDKQEHFAGSFILSSVIIPETYRALSKTKPTKTEVFLVTVGSMMIIGWAKEVRDGQGFGNKDINDIDADMLGALLGAFCNITIRW